MISDSVTRADLLALRSELRAYVDFRTAALKVDAEFERKFERHKNDLIRMVILYVVGLNVIAAVTVLILRRLGHF